MSNPTCVLTSYLELDVEVVYEVTPGSRGARDSLGGKRGAGPPLEPDSQPEVEILEVWAVMGKQRVDITSVVTQDALDSFTDDIQEKVAEDAEDDGDPNA